MTRATDSPVDGDDEDEEPEPDEERAGNGPAQQRLEDVDHTHPHTDETFDETGVHWRGKAREAEDDADAE